MDTIRLSLKNQLILLTAILFVGLALFWQKEIHQIISEKKQIFLPATIISDLKQQEIQEPVNIILPEKTKETEATKATEAIKATKETEAAEITEVLKPSLTQIQEQINAISNQIVLVSQTANKLTEANKEKQTKESIQPEKESEKVAGAVVSVDKSAKLNEIEQKITEISKQIETISQLIGQMKNEHLNAEIAVY